MEDPINKEKLEPIEATSPYYQYVKNLSENLKNEGKFLELLAHFTLTSEDIQQKANLCHWLSILSLADKLLQGGLAKLQEGNDKSQNTVVGLILEFYARLFSKAKNKGAFTAVAPIIDVLKLDDWDLIIKALESLLSITGKGAQGREETKSLKNKQLSEWLLKIAFGYSLNSSVKLSFLEVLKDSSLINADLNFQYFNLNEANSDKKDSLSISVLHLTGLYKDPRNSAQIVKELVAKNSIKEELTTDLHCKVRLAKTIVDENSKKKAVIASMLSYIIFIFSVSDKTLVNQFMATEPKAKLIPNVIQLLRENVDSDIHTIAFHLITALLVTDINHSIGIDLFPAVVNQIGLISPSGVLQSILRDISSTNLSKDPASGQYIATASPELLPRKTAESPHFALAVLDFLTCFERNEPRGPATLFGGLITSLFNFLSPPVEGIYPYYLPIVTKAMQILQILIRQSVEDNSSTDLIIERLSIEIEYLKRDQSRLCYAKRSLDEAKDKLQPVLMNHRQELCKCLFRLLSSSIHLTFQRNPILQQALRPGATEMRHHLRQNVRAMRPKKKPEEKKAKKPEEKKGKVENDESEDSDEEEEKAESIAISRRVLESPLIENCREIFAGTEGGAIRSYDCLSYSALLLIASIIRDIPTSVPDLIARKLIPAIISCYFKRIPAEENYLRDLLKGLNAIVLHEEGAKLVAQGSLIRKILYTLRKDEYSLSFAGNPIMEDCARQLLNMYSQAPALRKEIVESIRDLFLGISMNGRDLIMQMATNLMHEKTKYQNWEENKEAIMKKCSNFSIVLKGILLITVSLLNNTESQDQQKMIEALNDQSEMTKIMLILNKVAGVIGIYTKSLRKSMACFQIILRQYYMQNAVKLLDEKGAMTANILEQHLTTIYNKINKGDLNKIPDLSDYLNGIKSLNIEVKTADEAFEHLAQFPKEDQILIWLNSIANWCESSKSLSGYLVQEKENVINMLFSLQKLLHREIMRMAGNQFKSVLQWLGSVRNTDVNLSAGIGEFTHIDTGIKIGLKFETEAEQRIEMSYVQITREMISILKAWLQKRKADFHNTNLNKEVIWKNIILNYSKNLKEHHQKFITAEIEPDQNACLITLGVAGIIADIKIVLFAEPQQIWDLEFFNQGGFDTLMQIYSLAVKQRCTISDISSAYAQALNHLISVLVSVFDLFLDPGCVKRKLDNRNFIPYIKTLNNGEVGSRLHDEDAVSSLIYHFLHFILIETKYYHYDTFLRFIQEINLRMFEVITLTMKKYFDKGGAVLSMFSKLESAQNQRGDKRQASYLGFRSGHIAGFQGYNVGRIPYRIELPPPISRIAEHASRVPPAAAKASTSTVKQEIGDGKETSQAAPAIIPEAKKEQDLLLTSGINGLLFIYPVKIIPPKKFVDALESTLFEPTAQKIYISLFSICKGKYKYVICNFFDSQEKGNYTSEKVFNYVMGQINLLMFQLDLRYELPPATSSTIDAPDILDPIVGRQTSEKIKARGFSNQVGKYVLITKIKYLIDILLTFIKSSKKKEKCIELLPHIRCCLIEILSTILHIDYYFLHVKMIPRILFLLSMIYKDHCLFSVSCAEDKEKGTERKIANEINPKKIAEISHLIEVMSKLISFSEPLDHIILQKKPPIKDGLFQYNETLVTSETLTLLILILDHIAQHYEFVPLIMKSIILKQILELKVMPLREKIPTSILLQLVFHLIESPKLLQNYMERIIKFTLISRAGRIKKNKEKDKVEKKEEEKKKMEIGKAEELKESHDESNTKPNKSDADVDLDSFMMNFQFLADRDPEIFMKACKKIVCLKKIMEVEEGAAAEETTKEQEKKEVKKIAETSSPSSKIPENNSVKNQPKPAQFIVCLTIDTYKELEDERKKVLPNIPIMCPNLHTPTPGKVSKRKLSIDSVKERELSKYKLMLQKTLKEDLKSMADSFNTDLISMIMERLFQLYFQNYSYMDSKINPLKSSSPPVEKPETYVIAEEMLLGVIGEIAKVYPEMLSYILCYKSTQYSRIKGSTIISFLIRYVFPQKYIKEVNNKFEVEAHDNWKQTCLRTTKYFIYYNTQVLYAKQVLIHNEIRRRILLEIASVLSDLSNDKHQIQNILSNPRQLSLLYSSLQILEGLLLKTENSILFPLCNSYDMVQMLMSSKDFYPIKPCFEILKQLNIHNPKSELISTKITIILNCLSKYAQHKGSKYEGHHKRDHHKDQLQNLQINPAVIEAANMEEEIENEGDDESIEAYSDVYNEAEPEDFSMANSSEIMEEEMKIMEEGEEEDEEGSQLAGNLAEGNEEPEGANNDEHEDEDTKKDKEEQKLAGSEGEVAEDNNDDEYDMNASEMIDIIEEGEAAPEAASHNCPLHDAEQVNPSRSPSLSPRSISSISRSVNRRFHRDENSESDSSESNSPSSEMDRNESISNSQSNGRSPDHSRSEEEEDDIDDDSEISGAQQILDIRESIINRPSLHPIISRGIRNMCDTREEVIEMMPRADFIRAREENPARDSSYDSSIEAHADGIDTRFHFSNRTGRKYRRRFHGSEDEENIASLYERNYVESISNDITQYLTISIYNQAIEPPTMQSSKLHRMAYRNQYNRESRDRESRLMGGESMLCLYGKPENNKFEDEINSRFQSEIPIVWVIKETVKKKEDQKKDIGKKEEEKKKPAPIVEPSTVMAKTLGEIAAVPAVRPPPPPPSQEVIEQRRQEFLRILPNVQVEDKLLMEIDLDFLKALPQGMRFSAVEPFLSRSSPPRPPQDTANPAAILSNIPGISIAPQLLPLAPGNNDMHEEDLPIPRILPMFNLEPIGDNKINNSRNKMKRLTNFAQYLSEDAVEDIKKEVAPKIANALKALDEKSVESVLRLLFLNIKTHIPLNSLICNLCFCKKFMPKIIDSLVFILAHYLEYEKAFPIESFSATDPEKKAIQYIALTDSCFPPKMLYNAVESSHLTYFIVSLRIFSLLNALLKYQKIVNLFLPKIEEAKEDTKGKKYSLFDSVKKLRKSLGCYSQGDFLSEIFSLVNCKPYKNTLIHLEQLVSFTTELFKQYYDIHKSSKKKIGAIPPPKISQENVTQILKMLFLEIQTEKSCKKIQEVLAKICKNNTSAKVIVNAVYQLVKELSVALMKEWSPQMKLIEAGIAPKAEIEGGSEQASTENRFGRIVRLLRSIYDGVEAKPATEEKQDDQDAFMFCANDDDEDEAVESTPAKRLSEKLSYEGFSSESNEVKKFILSVFDDDMIYSLYDMLTEMITAISRRTLKIQVAIKYQFLMRLVPLIESLMVSYDMLFKNISVKKGILNEIKKSKKEGLPVNSIKAKAFSKFLYHNSKPFNNLIRQMEFQTFADIIKPFILRFPSFLDFDNKRSFFRSELKKLPGYKHRRELYISVARDRIFEDSFTALHTKKPEEIKGRLNVKFKGEAGVDAGGVTREWYTALSRAMFNPDISLFKLSAHGNTYYPDPKSTVHHKHIEYFKFIGRIIGKAIYDGQYLDCFFTRAFYKILARRVLNIHDLEDYDAELYKGLQWVLTNDPSELESTFSYTLDYFGEHRTIELIENGSNIKVTDLNKHDFIERMCKAKLYEEIKPQMTAILEGIYDIIPKKLLSLFNPMEIELLISGLPDIDIMDLKKNTEYRGYRAEDQNIVWFWELLESFSNRERAQFLQFVTGTSKVPIEGFKRLPGMNGICRFSINRVDCSSDRLPTAHTCFNQLDLPVYPSKEILFERVTKAVQEGCGYMGLA